MNIKAIQDQAVKFKIVPETNSNQSKLVDEVAITSCKSHAYLMMLIHEVSEESFIQAKYVRSMYNDGRLLSGRKEDKNYLTKYKQQISKIVKERETLLKVLDKKLDHFTKTEVTDELITRLSGQVKNFTDSTVFCSVNGKVTIAALPAVRLLPIRDFASKMGKTLKEVRATERVLREGKNEEFVII